MINAKQTLVWGAWLVVFLIGSVEAQNTTTSSAEEALLVPVESGLNSSWMLICGFLVFFMQAGFAILEAGAVAKSDTRNILFKNLLDVCVAGLAWWGFGFAFAFGTGDHHGRGFIGARYFFADDFPNAEEGVGYAFWFFEFCFAAASATIVSGAVAERATFQVYVCWCLISTIWVYPVVAHWEWSSQGWLSATNSVDPVLDIGMIDFAGCGAVHMVGGIGALIGAIVSGFRNKRSKVSTFKPRFEKINSKWLVNDIPGKSEIFSSLGVLMLWFSWYGFNCGSTLLISTTNAELTAARISATTTLSACAGGLTCVILGRLLSSTGKFNINDANNGILAGLVSITAGCACVELWAAVIIGFFGAIFFKFGSFLLLKFRIDDPVEASPLHLGCGIWGLMSCGIFATQEYNMEVYGRGDHYGLFMGGGGRQLGAQFVGVLAIGAWTTFWAVLFWVPAKLYDKRRQDKIFFKEEDVTGGVDQRFISVALTKDLHSTLANIGADLATEGSVGEIRVEMEHPGVMRSGSTLGERDKEAEELLKILSLNPGKRRAFLEFIESLPDDEESEYITGGHSEREVQRSGRSHRSHNTRGTNRQSVSSNHNSGTHSNVTTGHNANITGGHSNPNTGH